MIWKKKRLTSVEKELCGLLRVISGCRRLFFNNYDVVMYTDMQLLVKLYAHVTVCNSPKLTRWLAILSSLSPRFKLRWLPNTTLDINVSDFLSRNFSDGMQREDFSLPLSF